MCADCCCAPRNQLYRQQYRPSLPDRELSPTLHQGSLQLALVRARARELFFEQGAFEEFCRGFTEEMALQRREHLAGVARAKHEIDLVVRAQRWRLNLLALDGAAVRGDPAFACVEADQLIARRKNEAATACAATREAGEQISWVGDNASAPITLLQNWHPELKK
jgi:hypothetical protein